jgi:UDP-N-acetyl-D-glucosamine/UDP-N-acetyl-D-galactosamine dehydrogenase
MSLSEAIKSKSETISIIGLGYVGLPLAIEFSKKVKVIGFDVNNKKVDTYKAGIDVTKEVGNEEVKNSSVLFTSSEADLKNANFHIIAVPTPINMDKTPD